MGGGIQAGEMKTTLVLPYVRPPSWNDIYTGVHWAKRKKIVDPIHTLVRASIEPDWQPHTARVDITITVFFDKRPLDASNIAGKLYEDALKGRLIADDRQTCVRSVRTVSEIDRTNPRIVIEIEDIET